MKWIKDIDGNFVNLNYLYSIDLVNVRGHEPYVKAYHSCNGDSVILFEPENEIPIEDKLEFCRGYMNNLESRFFNDD